MNKLPAYLAFLSSLVVCITPALAQDAGQGAYPQQGYEAPQADAYRGQAQQSNSFGNTQAADSSTWARQQALEAGTSNNNNNANTTPIKPAGHGHLLGAVGHIGQMVGRAAVPVAMMGGMYMVTRAATTAGINNSMMAQRYGMGGMPMGGMGMPMGGMGMPMGGMGMPMGGYGMPMGGYGYNPMMNMMMPH
jgi:hypothetical protein